MATPLDVLQEIVKDGEDRYESFSFRHDYLDILGVTIPKYEKPRSGDRIMMEQDRQGSTFIAIVDGVTPPPNSIDFLHELLPTNTLGLDTLFAEDFEQIFRFSVKNFPLNDIQELLTHIQFRLSIKAKEWFNCNCLDIRDNARIVATRLYKLGIINIQGDSMDVLEKQPISLWPHGTVVIAKIPSNPEKELEICSIGDTAFEIETNDGEIIESTINTDSATLDIITGAMKLVLEEYDYRRYLIWVYTIKHNFHLIPVLAENPINPISRGSLRLNKSFPNVGFGNVLDLYTKRMPLKDVRQFSLYSDGIAPYPGYLVTDVISNLRFNNPMQILVSIDLVRELLKYRCASRATNAFDNTERSGPIGDDGSLISVYDTNQKPQQSANSLPRFIDKLARRNIFTPEKIYQEVIMAAIHFRDTKRIVEYILETYLEFKKYSPEFDQCLDEYYKIFGR